MSARIKKGTLKAQGFSVVEVVLVIVALLIVGGVGYSIYHRSRQPASATTSTASQQTQTSAANGTTQSIDNLTTQDSSSESSIDTKYTNSSASTAQNANGSTANLGGAYDESTF